MEKFPGNLPRGAKFQVEANFLGQRSVAGDSLNRLYRDFINYIFYRNDHLCVELEQVQFGQSIQISNSGHDSPQRFFVCAVFS